VRFLDLAPGDILMEFEEDEEGPAHSLMWAGGSKPVVHCAEGNKLNGVVAQSLGYFKNQSESPSEMTRVWRGSSTALGARAGSWSKT